MQEIALKMPLHINMESDLHWQNSKKRSTKIVIDATVEAFSITTSMATNILAFLKVHKPPIRDLVIHVFEVLQLYILLRYVVSVLLSTHNMFSLHNMAFPQPPLVSLSW